MLALDVLLVSSLTIALEVAGISSALHAIQRTRTSQGAIAWAMALVTVPFLSLPLYWVFGRTKYHGYVKARHRGARAVQELAEPVRPGVQQVRAALPARRARLEALVRLTRMPFTEGNRSRLLIDGHETFEAICAAIDAAADYVLVQFYIVRDDGIGRRLRDHLVARSRDGVRCYFLFDEIGSLGLSSRYVASLREHGVRVSAFKSTRGPANRFQVNFRNHRKTVVVDGRVAFVGGHNVGDEYLGLDGKLSPWRDTHVEVHGPAVQCVQLSFVEDWHWATGESPALDWTLRPAEGARESALVLPTGPADTFESCAYFFVTLAHAAERRLWIASPYLVPDSGVSSALQLAAMRGVDVRILLPKNRDQLLSWLASFAYLTPMLQAGVKILRYREGFMHQKVVLVDDDVCAVGTANLDNRSFRLNFELMILYHCQALAREVEEMLQRDLENAEPVPEDEYESRGVLFRLAVNTARLWAPIL